MAFSLKINTPNDVVTFQVSTLQSFTGYRLLSYQPGDTSGGDAPSVDTIVCDICGTSVDDAFDKLRKLERALIWANADNTGQSTSGPAYIEFQPVNSNNASWAVVMGGSVNAPPADYLATKGVISSVTIAVRREPFWRGYKPQYTSTLSSITTDVYSASVASRGKQTISGIAGDIQALVHLALGKATVGTSKRVARVAYVSARNNPNNHAVYGNFDGPSIAGYFSSNVSDAATENGSGNCTRLPTTTGGVYTPVAWTLLNQSGGTARVFARMRLSAGSTQWNAYAFATSADPSATPWPSNAGGVTAVITSTTYAIYDLGVVRLQGYYPTLNTYTGSPMSGSMNVGISGATISGSGLLNVDWMYLMPVHESFIECVNAVSDVQSMVYDNMTPAPRNASGVYYYNFTQPKDRVEIYIPRGTMRLPPGNGTFYWMIQNETGGSPTHTLVLRYCPLYSAPRGTGA